MKSVISDFSRDVEKRRACVKALTLDNDLLRPRLWTPIYDPHVTYICYGPSPLSCSASFPDEEYDTYSEYFGNKRLYPVSPGSRLFATQRLWHLPQSSIGSRRHSAEKKKISERTKEIHTLSDGERAPCDRLISVLLPQDACMETPISDVPLLLHSIMIPQVMYEVGRYQTVAAFLGHCRANLPILSSYLETVQFATVLEALTAKSCALDISYDRLEWFGDSVLKLIQTDTLLNSTELQQWITCLHEGDLTALRSGEFC
jgi:dsRNA-specific ribonuclease